MEQSQFENVKNAEESALVSHWACLKSHVMFEDRRICDKIAKSPDCDKSSEKYEPR